MVRAKLYFRVVMLSLVALLIGACTSQPSPTPTPVPPGTINQASQGESQKIAEEFLRNRL